MSAQQLAPIALDSIVCAGGVDQITPTLALKNGFARQAINFEAAVTGGYTRIAGYERVDGHTAPTDTTRLIMYLTVLSPAHRPTLYATLSVTSPASSGKVVALDATGTRFVITGITGDFAVGGTLKDGATVIGTITTNEGPVNPLEDAQGQQSAANYYRSLISAVPGSGPIRGVAMYKDVLYAWRNDALGAFKDCYKATGSGWSKVAAMTCVAGGAVQTVVANFAGQATSTMLYIADGVSKAAQWDGTNYTQITTGATTDTPSRVAAHRNYLFLALGSSVLHSGPGLPLNFAALDGANEIATGDTITDMVVMPGGTGTSTLGIFSRTNTGILYGTSPSDWNFIQYNTGSGAVMGSAQNMAQTLVLDDRGALSLQTALQYGNFDASTLTNLVLPFINSHMGTFTAATLSRRKSQYRLFFSNGDGLYITSVNGKLLGCMPVYYPHVVLCTYEGKLANGADVMFFGSDDGFVYQMDKGTSFDGEVIDFALSLSYTNAKNPRMLKRFRKASVEISTEAVTQVTFDFSAILGYDPVNYDQPLSTNYGNFVASSRWDEFTWDNFFWDTSNTAPIECELDGTAESIALLFNGTSDYTAPFNINSILIHYSPRRMMR